MTRLLIANRGEIARRILRAGRARGYVVAVVSTPEDAAALVRREADAVLEQASFLAIPEIVAAAAAWGAELVHPGYGYLAENAEFAQAVEAAGIAFVGPTPANMRALGSKEAAKALARSCGIPTLEAVFARELQELPRERWGAELAARGLRPPFLVKASGGGGGRGMRVVDSVQGLRAALQAASAEALAVFGDGTVFLERRLRAPRHVEVQVFGDGRGHGVFLGERECSLQRRHQKVVEEAPGARVDAVLREALGRAALALVEATAYRGAGTAEFLLDDEGGFHFLEMNTRLQVEHPVTELVHSVDLVQAQLDLAEGRWPDALGDPCRFTVAEPCGVALEARILAETPRNDFLPATGILRVYREPSGPGVRVDSGVQEGDPVTAHFDSMIAKLIVHGRDRAEAVGRLAGALDRFAILGCATNLSFLRALSRHPDFLAGLESTVWIAENLAILNETRLPAPWSDCVASRAFPEALASALADPARRPEGLAARFVAQSHAELRAGGTSPRASLWLEPVGDHPAHFALHVSGEGDSMEMWVCRCETGFEVSAFGETWRVEDPAQGAALGALEDVVRAPMAGKVIEVRTAVGDRVEKGQVLFLVESMKMQLEVTAPRAGRVASVAVVPGQILGGPGAMAVLEGP